ncbi:MAG: transposase, partial [Thauera propionica]|nr:transposase [Thauera propionica]
RPKTYLLGQRGVEQKVSELGQQRLVVEYSSSYCLFINDLTNAILPVSHRVHKGYKLKLRALGLDGRTTRTEGYRVSQRKRKRVEEIFGWLKTVGGLRKSRFIGQAKTQMAAFISGAAYNLLRIAKLSVSEVKA